MKAAVKRTPDTPPGYGDFPEPVAGEGREIVELAAAGVHPIVRSLAEGHHYGSTGTWPLIPGVDAVARTPSGTLVYTGYVEAPYGTLAERMAVPATMQLPLPQGAEPARIAGGLNPGLASWMPLQSRVGEAGTLGTVVVLGATGMAGMLAVQNASLLGAAQIVGVGRDPAGLERAAQTGATPVALTGDRETDAAALAAAFDGRPSSLILDFVWGPPAEAMFAALARRGLREDSADIAYVQIGAAAGPEASVPAALLRSRRIQIRGSGAGSAPIAAIIAQLPAYMQLIADGRVHIPTRTFPLSHIADAGNTAQDSGPRVVIVPG
ncbi:MAG TPA: zinc-binding alcohol dehydrogenase family protein [Streptosporangiaceae bacterium]